MAPCPVKTLGGCWATSPMSLTLCGAVPLDRKPTPWWASWGPPQNGRARALAPQEPTRELGGDAVQVPLETFQLGETVGKEAAEDGGHFRQAGVQAAFEAGDGSVGGLGFGKFGAGALDVLLPGQDRLLDFGAFSGVMGTSPPAISMESSWMAGAMRRKESGEIRMNSARWK